MTSYLKLKQRRDKAFKELDIICTPILSEHGLVNICDKIGKTLKVSGQTVMNYVNKKNKTADGFLLEAITDEFKKYL